jgi:cell division protein ZapA (FtsZ GTPase activity inhibitor)
MSDNSSAAKLEFTIYNLPFRLRAPVEDHERLKRAAKHVDELMRHLSETQVTPDTGKLALQAALLSTVEYYKIIDDAAIAVGMTEDVKRRVDNLIAQLENELADL